MPRPFVGCRLHCEGVIESGDGEDSSDSRGSGRADFVPDAERCGGVTVDECAESGRVDEGHAVEVDHEAQSATIGQLSVRVTPSIACT